MRRALIAGGFGTGSRSGVPAEIAQVVSLGDCRNSSIPEKSADLEAAIIVEEQLAAASPSPSDGSADGVPIDLEDTPFFHFDIVSAVRAAEYNLTRIHSSSTRVSEDSGKHPITEVSENVRSR